MILENRQTYQRNGELLKVSQDNIIVQIEKGVSTRHSINNICEHMTFVSQIEPKSICDALKDENWIVVMHDVLN